MTEFAGLETSTVDGNPSDESVQTIPVEVEAPTPQEKSTAKKLADGEDDEAIPSGNLPDEKPEELKEEVKKEKEPEKLKPEEDPVWLKERLKRFTKQKYEHLDQIEREKQGRIKAEAELQKIKTAQREAETKKLDDLINAQEPDPAGYTTEQAYYKDYALWAMRKENAQRDKANIKPEPTPEVDTGFMENEARVKVRQAIIKAGTQTYDDFNEVVLENEGLTITPIMVDTMGDEDNAADIAYYLGKNPDIANRIARLPALMIAKEIGKISVLVAKDGESISQEPDPNTDTITIKKTTSAPEPINPIGGRAPVKKPLDKMTNEEYRAARGFTKDAMPRR